MPVAKLVDNIHKGMNNKQLCFYKPNLGIWEFLELEQNEPEYWTHYVNYCELDCESLLHVWNIFRLNMKTIIKQMGTSKNF